MDNMKILVLGVNGMAGHVVALYLQEKGHEVIGFAKTESEYCSTIIGDAEKAEDLFYALRADEYDYVINCIGILNAAVDRKLSRGIYLNSVLPHLIAEILEDKKTKLIHISTDCIFRSDTVYYTEISSANAESYYGRSKALGEINDEKNLTIRTSIVGPELKSNGTGLFHWFMCQKNQVLGYANVAWTGITTVELAKAIEYICVNRPQLIGVINLVNNAEISKYDLLLLFNHFFRCDQINIVKDEKFFSNKRLMSTRDDIQYIIPGYEEMVEEMLQWMYGHRNIYHQYIDSIKGES